MDLFLNMDTMTNNKEVLDYGLRLDNKHGYNSNMVQSFDIEQINIHKRNCSKNMNMNTCNKCNTYTNNILEDHENETAQQGQELEDGRKHKVHIGERSYDKDIDAEFRVED